MIKSTITSFLGFCPKSKVWNDYAIIGFFLLGTCLGLVLGMCIMTVAAIRHIF